MGTFNKLIATVVTCLVIVSFSYSQTFIDISAGLTGVSESSAAWGDYDNDGDLDLILCGANGSYVTDNITKIYRNDGAGVFTDINTGLPGIHQGSVCWGDYDNDNDLDVLLTGRSGFAPTSKIFRNEGSDVFTDINAGLTGLWQSSASWGDYDNDGDLDALIHGASADYPNLNLVSKVFRNNGNGSFTDMNVGLMGIAGSVAWGDCDNDGDLDALLAGSLASGSTSKIFRSDGNGVFTDINAGLTEVWQSYVTWNDYDSDGDLDAMISGLSNSGTVSKIYRNSGNNVFNFVDAGLTGNYTGSQAWGDCDNDGDQDLIMVGDDGGNPYAKIFRNNGDNTFTDIVAGLTGVRYSSTALGDYDNDNDLDILLTGYTIDSLYVSKIYRNNATTPNTIPTMPDGLNAQQNNGSITLTWNKATDNETSQNGLTYNVYFGTQPGYFDRCPPMADLSTGLRRIPAMGNGQTSINYVIKNLSPGTYYWSVQTIDNAFAGSPFATGQCFFPTTVPELCIVTVDTTTWKNKIIWNKLPSADTDSFCIYKETSLNEYSRIGSVAYDNPNYFIDVNSVPESHSDKYKVTSVDSCGNETGLSQYHKTMNLVISVFGSTMGLIWTPYEDESGSFAPGKYYIYKGTSPSDLQLLDSVSGSVTSYNDINVFNTYYYMVGVKKAGGCDVTKDFISESFSNKKLNFGSSVNEYLLSDLSIYPNPVCDRLNINIDEKADMEIMNIRGQILVTKTLTEKLNNIDISGLTAGIYTLRIKTAKGVVVKKLIKQ